MRVRNPVWIYNYWQRCLSTIVISCIFVLIFFTQKKHLIWEHYLLIYLLSVLILVVSMLLIKTTKKINASLIDRYYSSTTYSAFLKGNTSELIKLDKENSCLKISYPREVNPVGMAIYHNHSELLIQLIKRGYSLKKPYHNYERPISLVLRLGLLDIFNTIKEKSPKAFKQLEKEGITEFMIHSFAGDEEYVKKYAGIILSKRDDLGFSALSYALLGAKNPEVIKYLIIEGSDDIISDQILILKKSKEGKGSDLINNKMPLVFYAFNIVHEDILIEMISRLQNLDIKDDEGKTLLIHGVIANKLVVVRYLVEHQADIKIRDDHMKNALNYAKDTGNTLIINILDPSSSAPSNPQNAHKVVTPPSLAPQWFSPPQTMKNIDIIIVKNVLRGMQQIDSFAEHFHRELNGYYSAENGKFDGIVLWGDSQTGKTEIAKRFCGLSKTAISPVIPNMEFKYIDCIESIDNIKAIVDSVNPSIKCVFFLDSIDVVISEKSKIKDAKEVHHLRELIRRIISNTNFFWVLIGRFSFERGKGELKAIHFNEIFGEDLARIFSSQIPDDFKLQKLTLESLIRLIRSDLSKFKGVEYEDEAMMVLGNYVLRKDAGVKGLLEMNERLIHAVKKKFPSGESIQISKEDVNSYIEKLEN